MRGRLSVRLLFVSLFCALAVGTFALERVDEQTTKVLFWVMVPLCLLAALLRCGKCGAMGFAFPPRWSFYYEELSGVRN